MIIHMHMHICTCMHDTHVMCIYSLYMFAQLFLTLSLKSSPIAPERTPDDFFSTTDPPHRSVVETTLLDFFTMTSLLEK